MGIDVAVRDEEGIQQQVSFDEKNLLRRLIGYPDFSSFPMIASIDHYGDTTFNRIQVGYLLSEWADIAGRASTVEEKTIVGKVKELAEIVRDSVHLYLVFIGD